MVQHWVALIRGLVKENPCCTHFVLYRMQHVYYAYLCSVVYVKAGIPEVYLQTPTTVHLELYFFPSSQISVRDE